MVDSDAHVVVIGAGLAGLRCAQRLAGRVPVTLLEATDRTGGRCWSSRGWQAGQVAEHGGELIEDGQTHVLRAAQELGLVLESRSSGPRDVHVWHRGARHDAGEVHGFGQVLDLLGVHAASVGPVDYRTPSRRLRALDEMTAWDWIATHVEGGTGSLLGSSFELSTRITLGRDTRALSAVSLIHLWLGLPDLDDTTAGGFSFGQNMQDESTADTAFLEASASGVVDVWHVRGGNDLIAEGISRGLPDGCLQLGTPVSGVALTRSGRYEVVAVDGARFAADQVVIAMPPPAIANLDLTAAGVGAERLAAATEVLMGQHSKLLVQVPAQPSTWPDWPGVAIVDDPAFVAWDTSIGQTGQDGLLTLFTAGPVFTGSGSGHGAPDDQSRDRARRLLEQVAPATAAAPPGDMWLDNWPLDRWTGGSYAAYGPGQYTRFAGRLGQPDGGVHFAGEHTSLASWGYLDGALASGERAARDVLRTLGLTGGGADGRYPRTPPQ